MPRARWISGLTCQRAQMASGDGDRTGGTLGIETTVGTLDNAEEPAILRNWRMPMPARYRGFRVERNHQRTMAVFDRWNDLAEHRQATEFLAH